ncbi:MAG: hypothetical protein QME96_16470, partial [Myxococcota bacterium]|nr:hypothetical protein [Myxococcota bacterium]
GRFAPSRRGLPYTGEERPCLRAPVNGYRHQLLRSYARIAWAGKRRGGARQGATLTGSRIA